MSLQSVTCWLFFFGCLFERQDFRFDLLLDKILFAIAVHNVLVYAKVEKYFNDSIKTMYLIVFLGMATFCNCNDDGGEQ